MTSRRGRTGRTGATGAAGLQGIPGGDQLGMRSIMSGVALTIFLSLMAGSIAAFTFRQCAGTDKDISAQTVALKSLNDQFIERRAAVDARILNLDAADKSFNARIDKLEAQITVLAKPHPR